MEPSVCPNCGANVEGLLHRCDCGGADLAPEKPFLFFSVVAWRTSAMLIMDILRPVERAFIQRYGMNSYSEALDQIAIIPLCFPEEIHQDPEIERERQYVTLKNRYADLRLHISYESLIRGGQEERLRLCAENIASAAEYVHRKDKTFQKNAFLDAVSDCFYGVYGIKVYQ